MDSDIVVCVCGNIKRAVSLTMKYIEVDGIKYDRKCRRCHGLIKKKD